MTGNAYTSTNTCLHSCRTPPFQTSLLHHRMAPICCSHSAGNPGNLQHLPSLHHLPPHLSLRPPNGRFSPSSRSRAQMLLQLASTSRNSLQEVHRLPTGYPQAPWLPACILQGSHKAQHQAQWPMVILQPPRPTATSMLLQGRCLPLLSLREQPLHSSPASSSSRVNLSKGLSHLIAPDRTQSISLAATLLPARAGPAQQVTQLHLQLMLQPHVPHCLQ